MFRAPEATYDAWRARPFWTRANEQAWSYFGEVF
jgi:hypothetical protein